MREALAGDRIVLRPDRLFDGLDVTTGQAVEISGNRIVGVYPNDEDRGPSGTQIDLTGCTVLPGLIDCHSHLHYNGLRTAEALAGRSIEEAAFDAIMNAPRVLGAGFTTVRDVGTIGNVAVALRDLVKKGGARGPRILASGRIITATGGPNVGRNVRHDDGRGFCVHADGETEVLRAVRDQLELGVDNIKLMASGVEVDARVPTGVSVLRAEEMAIAVDEAHRWNRTVAAHCQSLDSARDAARAGVDTIEHGTRLSDETIELMLRNDVTLVPTLSTLFSVINLGEELGLTAHQRTEMEINRPLWLDSLERAHKAGVRIAVGGDIGNRYRHGENAHELVHLVDVGISPKEALRAATTDAAKAIGVAQELGAVREGMLADLVVVRGNPLDDISILQDKDRILMVIQGGQLVAGSTVVEAQDPDLPDGSTDLGRLSDWKTATQERA